MQATRCEPALCRESCARKSSLRNSGRSQCPACNVCRSGKITRFRGTGPSAECQSFHGLQSAVVHQRYRCCTNGAKTRAVEANGVKRSISGPAQQYPDRLHHRRAFSDQYRRHLPVLYPNAVQRDYPPYVTFAGKIGNSANLNSGNLVAGPLQRLQPHPVQRNQQLVAGRLAGLAAPQSRQESRREHQQQERVRQRQRRPRLRILQTAIRVQF